MSYVTNVLLLTSCNEEDGDTERFPAVEDLNNRLLAQGMVAFERIPLDAAGGKRYMEMHLFAAAFSYFDSEIIETAARACLWRNPDCVQIIAKGQDDPCFFRVCGSSMEGWKDL